MLDAHSGCGASLVVVSSVVPLLDWWASEPGHRLHRAWSA